MPFAQLVVGPPGSGKTSYCRAMKEFLKTLGRTVVVVNLDPANEFAGSDDSDWCDVDVRELVTLDDVAERLNLGPNGGLLQCMDYLADNLEWLTGRLEEHPGAFFLLDCPGQVELFTHYEAMQRIVQGLDKWGARLCAVHLVDSHYCSDVGKFISVLLTSLSTMLQLALPHINILSKIDLVETQGRLPFNLDFYTEVLDLAYLVDLLDDDPAVARYKRLNDALVGLIEDFSLVSFHTLNIDDKEAMLRVTRAADKAVGYIYSSAEEGEYSLFAATFTADPNHMLDTLATQDKYMADLPEEPEEGL